MVTTSLKIPQIDNVTTLVRCNSANSEVVIKNARIPGNNNMPNPSGTPLTSNSSDNLSNKEEMPSTGNAMTSKLTNMMGAKKNMELKGLEVAGFRSNRICVRAHRNPEKNEADMTRMKPSALKAVSPATIMITPTVIVKMMRTSLMEGDSSRNKKAKSRTKAREEDLHIAFLYYQSN